MVARGRRFALDDRSQDVDHLSDDEQQGIDLVAALGLHPLLPLAWSAASEAARVLRDERPTAIASSAKSSPTDTVTEMDTRSERLLIERLLGERPDDGLLGEEGGERPGTSGVRWVVDPLDGTVSYLYGLPTWGVSVAAEVEGTPTVGVVLTPAFDEGYLAVAGRGAWHVQGGRAWRLRLAAMDDLSMAMVATGFGYQPDQRRRQAEILQSVLPKVRDLRRTGSAVVDFCWLARGRLDAYYEAGLNAWDMAAGALIAHEAGAVVRGLTSEDYSSGVMVASRPGIADGLRSLLVLAGA